MYAPFYIPTPQGVSQTDEDDILHIFVIPFTSASGPMSKPVFLDIKTDFKEKVERCAHFWFCPASCLAYMSCCRSQIVAVVN